MSKSPLSYFTLRRYENRLKTGQFSIPPLSSRRCAFNCAWRKPEQVRHGTPPFIPFRFMIGAPHQHELSRMYRA
jgi:hypothetical protein